MPRLLATLLLLFLLHRGSSADPVQGQEASDASQLLDDVVVIGDMLVPQSLYQAYFNSSTTRKAASVTSYLWPPEEEGGVPTVPYTFQNVRYRREIEAGMRHWEEHTCLAFRQKTGSDTHWLRFVYGSGCWSYIGRLSTPYYGQDVSIGLNCEELKIVVHEIGHAIGLFHEQMRSDRDDYVVINWDNISGGMESNFAKEERFENNLSVPYDYTSIMHYGGRDFSSNGRTTLATKAPEHQGLLSRATELTHRDKHIVNLMYGCIDIWMTQCAIDAPPCEGEGYLGRDCTCVCPPGREGDRCEVVKADYYDNFLSACSMTITTETNFTSPDYPKRVPQGTWCVYKVEAPLDMVPEVIFNSFSLYPRLPPYPCIDIMEVRDSNLHDGPVYCGDEIKAEQSFVGASRHVYLYMDIQTPLSEGFEAEVVFHNASDSPDPNSKAGRNLTPSTVLVLVLALVAGAFRKT